MSQLKPAWIEAYLPDIPKQYRGVDVSPDSAASRARYYLAILGFGVASAPETSLSWRWAGGGYRLTPGDLARFVDAVFAGAVLDEKHLAQMTTPRTMANGERNPQNDGLGWRTGLARNPTEVARTTPAIDLGGTAANSRCMSVATPELKVSVAICGNAWTGVSGFHFRLATDIAWMFIDPDGVDVVGHQAQPCSPWMYRHAESSTAATGSAISAGRRAL